MTAGAFLPRIRYDLIFLLPKQATICPTPSSATKVKAGHLPPIIYDLRKFGECPAPVTMSASPSNEYGFRRKSDKSDIRSVAICVVVFRNGGGCFRSSGVFSRRKSRKQDSLRLAGFVLHGPPTREMQNRSFSHVFIRKIGKDTIILFVYTARFA